MLPQVIRDIILNYAQGGKFAERKTKTTISEIVLAIAYKLQFEEYERQCEWEADQCDREIDEWYDYIDKEYENAFPP